MRKIQLDEQAVVAMYEQVETIGKVAEKFGVSDETIRRILKRHNIKRTHRHQKPEPKFKKSNCRSKYCPALMVMLHEMMGYTARQISDVTGYRQDAIRNTLTRRGISVDRKCTYARDYDLDQIEREYLDGATTYELGEKYGVNHATISKWMRKRGVCMGKGNKSATPIEKTCPRCGKTFMTTHRDKEYCSKTCQRAVSWTRRHDRMRVVGGGEDIPLREVYERDKGKCYICGRKTDFNDCRIVDGFKLCGSRYPTRDHVIAIHNGGRHEWSNIRLACHECNSRKKDKGQMRLAI